MNYGLASIEQRPQYGLGSFIKKIGKTVKKIIPKEIAPFVPAIAGAFLGPMAGSFLGGMGGIMGSAAAPSMLSGFLGRGLTDAATQMLTSGRVDKTSALMSGGLGALANYQSPTMLAGGRQHAPMLKKGSFGISKPGGAMDKILSKGRDFGQIGSGGQNPFSAEGFDSALSSVIDAPKRALAIGTTLGAAKAGGDEMAALQKAGQMADAAAGGQPQDAETRVKAIKYYMGQAGYTTSQIEDALAASGYANGGRVGFQDGGPTFSDMSGNQITKEEFLAPLITQMEAIVNMGGSEALGYTEEEAIRELDALYEMRGEQNAMENLPPMKPVPGYADGGGVMPNGDPISPDVPRGMQMDLRGGGFIPLGTEPRADDVPAMVGKDEFVLNDRAVKGIGKLLTGESDPRAGARALYQLQDQMEAMA